MVNSVDELAVGDTVTLVNTLKKKVIHQPVDAARRHFDVSSIQIQDNKVYSDEALKFTLEGEPGEWLLKAGDNYLTSEEEKQLFFSDGTSLFQCQWTITIDDKGSATIQNRSLAIFYNSGAPRFTTYGIAKGEKDSQMFKPEIYKKVED